MSHEDFAAIILAGLFVAALVVIIGIAIGQVDGPSVTAASNPNRWTETDRRFLDGLRTVRDSAGHCFLYRDNPQLEPGGQSVYTFAVVDSSWCRPAGAPER